MKKIRLSKCSLDKKEINSVIKTLSSDFLGMGPKVMQFEKILSNYFKRDTVCVSSGTSALHLAIDALDLESNAEIIIPSNTYVAGLQAVLAANKKPVLCDINKDNLSICIKDLELKITKHTKVIMPTLYGGDPGNIREVYKLARKYKIRVIEDAAHALGSSIGKKKIGSVGDIVCFSFDGIKNITSGEGGCVVSNDKKILNKIRESRFLSIKKESESRYVKKKQFEFDVERIGWRYHMSDIMASIGIEQIKKLNQFKNKRQKLAKLYIKLLSNNSKISFLNYNINQICPHIFVVFIETKFDRKKLKSYFEKKKIELGFHWKPIHEFKIIKKKYKFTNLKNTKIIRNKIITLPLHVDLTFNEVKYICKTLNTFINESK